ncbi:MAG: hypothetical protein Q7J25_08295 [Vicinamibacterales bacterium]|nr:hypothetical protein [Vicinamibacterales bacterium]
MNVRPALRRVAIVAFVILLPVVAHSVWDYIELHRLVHEIEAIRARSEPVSERDVLGNGRQLTEERDAASYYLAGAMLALGTSPYRVTTPIREWLAEPAPDRQSLPKLVTPLQQCVEDARDALTLADQAARLPFNGFPGGTEYSYRAASVAELSELVSARTLSLSASGDGDAAVESVIRGLQMRRALREARWFSVRGNPVAAVLSLSRPSPEALARLQAALEMEDKPERALENLLWERARYVEGTWRRYYGFDPDVPRRYSLPMRSITETVMRPWFSHKAVEVLRVWAELVPVAKLPWPQQAKASAEALDRFRAEESRRPGGSNPMINRGIALDSFARAVDPTPLIIDRSSRVALAVERFRRDRGDLPGALSDLVPTFLIEIPIDPFSGRSLVFRPATGAYTIYSVGPNQKDDRGDVSTDLPRPVKRGSDGNIIRAADIGIRVLIE